MSSDLRDILTPELPITRTIGGVTYDFPRTIEARYGVLLADGMNGTRESAAYFAENEEFSIRRVLMGDSLDAMIRDRCTDREIQLVLSYLTLFHTIDEKAAESFWDGLGKSTAPDGAEPSTTTAAENATSTASTSGTSTPKRKPRKKASPSRGR